MIALLDHILNIIKQVEVDYDIKVLYACESGSRAWGYPSMDSDFDVRFIYVHKINWYLSIDDKRDVLEIPKHDRISIEIHPYIDASGWELKKALKLLRKSNPTLLEWLHTEMVYYVNPSIANKMKELSSKSFNPIPCLFHYLNMAKRNMSDNLHGGEVKMKQYFNILRPILAAKWIKKHKTIPPVEFEKLLKEILPEGEVKEYIYTLLNRKIAGEKIDTEPKIDFLRFSLEDEIRNIEAYAKNIKSRVTDSTKQLDVLFRETLANVWI